MGACSAAQWVRYSGASSTFYEDHVTSRPVPVSPFFGIRGRTGHRREATGTLVFFLFFFPPFVFTRHSSNLAGRFLILPHTLPRCFASKKTQLKYTRSHVTGESHAIVLRAAQFGVAAAAVVVDGDDVDDVVVVVGCCCFCCCCFLVFLHIYIITSSNTPPSPIRGIPPSPRPPSRVCTYDSCRHTSGPS